jgi:hypothetical protein
MPSLKPFELPPPALVWVSSSCLGLSPLRCET